MRAGKLERLFEGSDDDLLASLRSVLRPEPLPVALRQRILADLDHRCVPARRSGLRPIRIVWLAAAACLTVALVLPPQRGAGPGKLAGPLKLSGTDAAEIVGAYQVLSWDSPLDYTIEAVHTSLESLSRSVERDPGGESLLPWGRDDDWDVPPTTDDDSSRSWAPRGAFCSAMRDWEHDG